MRHFLKTAISFIAEKLAVATTIGASVQARKLDKGDVLTNATLIATNNNPNADVVRGRGIVLGLGQVLPSVVGKIANRFISGLLGTGDGKRPDGQILIDHDLVPPVVAPFNFVKGFRSRQDSDNYVTTIASTLSRNLGLIETALDIFIVPLIMGGEFEFMGKTFLRFAFVRKDGCKTFKAAYRKWLAVSMGCKPLEATVDKYAKSVEYLKTAVYKTPFNRTVVVIPDNWTCDPKAFDGRGIHLCLKGSELLLHHDDLNFDITLRSVLHLRGWKGNSGTIYKGTSTPVTYSMLHHLVAPKHFKAVKTHLEDGCIVCTADTLKDAKVGTYENMEFYWHNDGERVSFWQDVKLTFSQWAMRRIFDSIKGIAMKLESNVKELSDVMRNGAVALARYLLKNREMFNDEDLPQNIVDVLELVNNRLPVWLHRSFEFSVLKAMGKVMKSLLEIRIGTRNMKHWNLKKHLGIGIRAFVAGDPTLGRDEIGIPKFAYKEIKRKLGSKVHLWELTKINGGLKWEEVTHFHWDWRDAVTKRKITLDKFFSEVRRHPQTFTSSQVMNLVVRDDDFAYLTLSTEIMDDFGADWDGDKMEIVIVPEILYKFRSADSKKVATWKRKVNWDMSSFYRPSVFNTLPELSDHHAQLFELLCSEPVGIPHFFAERVAHWMYLKQNATSEETFALVSDLEMGPITDIIAGKKHKAPKVVHLPELQRIANALKLPLGGDGYRIANAKVDFSKVVTGESDAFDRNGNHYMSKQKLTVSGFPAWIKSRLADKSTTITTKWPLHYVYFKSILKHFPDTISGTDVNLAELNPARLGEILVALRDEYPEVIVDKLKMELHIYRDGSIGSVKHPLLDKLHAAFMQRRSNKSVDIQAWMRANTDVVWTKLMSKFDTDEERAIAELFIVGYAMVNRDVTTTNKAKHHWLFAKVSASAFKKFMDLLVGSVDDDGVKKN